MIFGLLGINEASSVTIVVADDNHSSVSSATCIKGETFTKETAFLETSKDFEPLLE
jgi:hypothetical protein